MMGWGGAGVDSEAPSSGRGDVGTEGLPCAREVGGESPVSNSCLQQEVTQPAWLVWGERKKGKEKALLLAITIIDNNCRIYPTKHKEEHNNIP